MKLYCGTTILKLIYCPGLLESVSNCTIELVTYSFAYFFNTFNGAALQILFLFHHQVFYRGGKGLDFDMVMLTYDFLTDDKLRERKSRILYTKMFDYALMHDCIEDKCVDFSFITS